MKRNQIDTVLSEQQLERELQRTVQKKRRWSIFRNTLASLFVFASLIIILIVMFFPVYQVTEQSWSPELEQCQLVVACRIQNLKAGDIAVLHSDNEILMQRVIGVPSDLFQKDVRGNLSVNGGYLPEEYLPKPILQAEDITYPFQVPDHSYLVLASDQTLVSISEEHVIGKILFRIWPLYEIGFVS